MTPQLTYFTIGLFTGFYLTVAAPVYLDHRKTKTRQLSFAIAVLWGPKLIANLIGNWWVFKLKERETTN